MIKNIRYSRVCQRATAWTHLRPSGVSRERTPLHHPLSWFYHAGSFATAPAWTGLYKMCLNSSCQREASAFSFLKKGIEWCVFFSAFFIFTAQSFAQTDTIGNNSLFEDLIGGSNTQSVLGALDSAFYFIRQDYVLENDKGEQYGKGNQAYFGRFYGIGVAAAGHLWAEKELLCPWLKDDSYRVLAGDSLHPVRGQAFIRSIFSDASVEITTPSDSAHHLSFLKLPATYNGVGRHNELAPSGKLLILYTSDTSVTDTTNVSLTLVDISPEWDQKSRIGKVKPFNVFGTILGGAYFTELVTLGNIAYQAGALYAKKDDDWVLKAFPQILNQVKTAEQETDNRKNKKKP